MVRAAQAGGAMLRRGLDETSIGILLFVVGLSLGSIQGGIAKLLVADLPAPVVIWWRFLGLLTIVLPFAVLRYGVDALAPRRPLLHICRALLFVTSSSFFVLGVAGLPLAEMIAIVFIYPFLITAAAPLVLGERVDLATWIAVVTGFTGVLVVARPSLAGLNIHAVEALLCGATFALGLILTRKFLVAAPPTVTATWTAGTVVLAFGIALPFYWTTPDERQLTLLLLLGAISALSQIATITACGKCDMSTLAPFGYTEIVAATVTGLVMFGDFPDWITWAGIAIIILSGLYIVLAKRGRLPFLSRSRPPASH